MQAYFEPPRWRVLIGSLLTVALLALLILVARGQPAYAAPITVNTTADDLNTNGNCSLREAIQAASTDAAVDACPAGSGADTIVVPGGTYTLSILGPGGHGALYITEDLNITGAGAATTIIDAMGLGDRVLEIGRPFTGVPAVEISGLTIQNGSAPPLS